MNVCYPRARQKTRAPKWAVLLHRFLLWLEAQKPLVKNKLCALTLIAVGALSASIDGDGTAFVLLLFLAIPLLVAKENWIY